MGAQAQAHAYVLLAVLECLWRAPRAWMRCLLWWRRLPWVLQGVAVW